MCSFETPDGYLPWKRLYVHGLYQLPPILFETISDVAASEDSGHPLSNYLKLFMYLVKVLILDIGICLTIVSYNVTV